jgi:hypothetical protein
MDPEQTLVDLVLTGHVDNQELKPNRAKIYGSNLSLALQRAQAVRGWLKRKTDGIGRQTGLPPKDDVESIALLVTSGAEHVGINVSESDRTADRNVEIRASWRRPVPPMESGDKKSWLELVGRRLNVPPGLDAATMLALLAFIVALSAYLASVRVYVKGLASVSPRSKKTVALVLISVADLPMIFAGLFIALYIFAFPRAFLFLWGLFLFAFAGVTMIILHASEWLGSVVAIYKNRAQSFIAKK